LANRSQPQFFVQVAVPSPLHRCFDYLPHPDYPLPEPGCRVQVGFGRQTLTGIVIGLTSETDTPADKLRPLTAILDAEPLLDPPLLSLYRWASQYYLFPVGLALQTSLPKTLREGKPLAVPTRQVWQLI